MELSIVLVKILKLLEVAPVRVELPVLGGIAKGHVVLGDVVRTSKVSDHSCREGERSNGLIGIDGVYGDDVGVDCVDECGCGDGGYPRTWRCPCAL